MKALKYIDELIELEEGYLEEYDISGKSRPKNHIDRCNDLLDARRELIRVGGSLPLVEIDQDVLKLCVEAYKSGDKITAVKWLIEEAKKERYTFGIKWANEYLERQ